MDEDSVIPNIDENALTSLGKAGYGGLILKHDESFQLGFFVSVGILNILLAEMQALLIGVKLCWELGYRKLICYSSKFILLRIGLFLFIYNTLFEGNSCVDILFKTGANSSDHLVTFNEPLLCLSSTLLGDALDVSFSRT